MDKNQPIKSIGSQLQIVTTIVKQLPPLELSMKMLEEIADSLPQEKALGILLATENIA